MRRDLIAVDERRLLVIPGNMEETILFAVEKWIECAEESIRDHDFFAVALSGGSTPKHIFQKLSSPHFSERVDWKKVLLFWSDERAVPPTDPESNFRMAMEEGGLKKLPILKEHIYRMVAEEDIETNAADYEKLILEKLGAHPFDLIMLGMGDDGHTASLFPQSVALSIKKRLVVPNFASQKSTWRMTFTFDCINSARHICVYVIGANKTEILNKVFTSSFDYKTYPVQNVGTQAKPALWIVDIDAAKKLPIRLNYPS